jgi:hypothetical protein
LAGVFSSPHQNYLIRAGINGGRQRSRWRSLSQADYFYGRAAATTARGWAIVNYVSELVLEARKFANKKSSSNAQVQAQAV